MEPRVQDLHQIVGSLQDERIKLTRELRDGARESREALEKLLWVVYRMHHVLYELSQKLLRLTEDYQRGEKGQVGSTTTGST